MESSKQKIEIRNKNVAENVKELMVVMESLMCIDQSRDDNALNLDVIEQYLRTIDKNYEIKKEAELKRCVKLGDESRQLDLMAARVDKEITGPKGVEAIKTKERIKKFEETTKEYLTSLKK
jgi:hypothetical protein